MIYFQADYSTTTINYCDMLQLLNLHDNLFVIQKKYLLDAYFDEDKFTISKVMHMDHVLG